MNRKLTLGSGAIALLAVLFIGLTVLFGQLLRGWRIDLTENRLYTIAPGTQNILRSLPEPVNLYLFFTDEAANTLPAMRTYGNRVREFLEELESRSDGKLRLTVVDPQPFSEEEDRAAEFGVRAMPLGASGQQLYLGLAGTNSTDGREVIEFFDPANEARLEYDVAKLIQKLGNPKKPVVGWLSSIPMDGGLDPMTGQPSTPWAVFAQAQQLFDVRLLDAANLQLPADLNVLAIVHPKGLSPAALFEIDQFALRGGHVLLFVDPVAEADPSAAEPGNPLAALGADRASRLDPLLAAWGVAFDRTQAIGDLEHGVNVAMRQGDAPIRHIGILSLDPGSIAQGDVITAALSSINLASTGFVAPAEGAGTTFEPLLQTSAQAAPIPAERFQMLMDPSTLRDGFKPTGQRYALAARVSGPVRSAFPDGPPAGVTLAPGTTALAASQQPLNLIVFADTDLLSDFLWVREQNFFGQRVATAWANNGDVVWNALDNLAGTNDLVSVRGRAAFSRPFERVDEIRRQAEDRFRAKELELEQQLEETEQKLAALESGRGEAAEVLLTPEQQVEIERFQAEKLRIRKELREVRLGMDQEIRNLGNDLKLLNILVFPLIFAAVALLFAAWRRRLQNAIVALERDRAQMKASKEAPPAEAE